MLSGGTFSASRDYDVESTIEPPVLAIEHDSFIKRRSISNRIHQPWKSIRQYRLYFLRLAKARRLSMIETRQATASRLKRDMSPRRFLHTQIIRFQSIFQLHSIIVTSSRHSRLDQRNGDDRWILQTCDANDKITGKYSIYKFEWAYSELFSSIIPFVLGSQKVIDWNYYRKPTWFNQK